MELSEIWRSKAERKIETDSNPCVKTLNTQTNTQLWKLNTITVRMVHYKKKKPIRFEWFIRVKWYPPQLLSHIRHTYNVIYSQGCFWFPGIRRIWLTILRLWAFSEQVNNSQSLMKKSMAPFIYLYNRYIHTKYSHLRLSPAHELIRNPCISNDWICELCTCDEGAPTIWMLRCIRCQDITFVICICVGFRCYSMLGAHLVAVHEQTHSFFRTPLLAMTTCAKYKFNM